MLKRKEKIIIGALELLEAGGINGLTTKKLAAQQGVSEPALYRQYKGKLDIVKTLIDEYASFDMKIMNTVEQSEMSGKEAIDFYVTKFAERYRNYPEITTIMFSMDVYYYNEDTKLMMETIVHQRLEFLQKTIKTGQNKEEISNQFTGRELAELIDGLIFSKVYLWRINGYIGDFEKDLKATVAKLL